MTREIAYGKEFHDTVSNWKKDAVEHGVGVGPQSGRVLG